MNYSRPFIKRLVLAGGLALGVLATAVLSGPTAGADAPKPAASRTPTPPPAPATPTATSGFAGPLPQMTAVEVRALGTEATLSFITTLPSAVTIDYRQVPGPAGFQSPAQGYVTTHERKLTGLKSNTTYEATVTATTQSGETHTAKTSFTTAKKRVRVMLQSIDIKKDGDLIGDGEPLWYVTVKWTGSTGALYCYPMKSPQSKYCDKHGTFGEGRITPRNSAGYLPSVVFAEEYFDRFPDSVSVSVLALEEDNAVLDGAGLPWVAECLSGGCPVGSNGEIPAVWRVPQGVEFASQYLTVRADDPDTGFESVLTFSVELTHNNSPYSVPARNVPSSSWN